MKNLLKILLSTTIVVSSTTTIVACGTNNNNNDNTTLENWDDPDVRYQLFGKQFDSKTGAVDYFLKHENEITNIQDYKNEILLSNKNFDNLESVYQHIDKYAGIKKLTTQKNPNDYLVDSLGTVSEQGITDEDSLITVNKDANNKVVYSDSQEEAKQKVLASYHNKIVEGFEADGKFFRSIEELKSYYQQKYLQDDNLKQEEYFRLGNFWYTKENFESNLSKSIQKTINYNNVTISEENRFNLNRFELTSKDEEKIVEIDKKPGMFYIEANPDDDGHLEIDGGNFQKSTENITEMLTDVKKWEKTSSETTGLGDALMNTAVMGIGVALGSLGYYDAMNDGTLQKVSGLFDSLDVYNKKYKNYIDARDALFPARTLKQKNVKISTKSIEDILKKYQILSKINTLWENLNSMSQLEQNKKFIIILYNIRELMRNLDTSLADKKELDEFFYNSLLSLNVFALQSQTKSTKNLDIEMSDQWVSLVEQAQANNNIYEILDLLMDPNYMNQTRANNSSANIFKNYVNFATSKKDELMEYLKLVENILAHVGAVVESVGKVAKVLSKGMVWFSAATDLLNSIPLQNTSTYQFIIPDTKNKIIYQKTSWMWNFQEFDPLDVVQSLKISEPIEQKSFLYNETYFNRYEDAVEKLKTDIVDNLFADPTQVKFASKFFEQIFETDKNVLIKKIWELTDSELAFTNGFGEIKDNKTNAINSAIQRITEGSFEKAFLYDNAGVYIYGYDLEQVKRDVTNSIALKTKQVEFTDVLKNPNFDDLKDLNNQSYDVYSFVFNGKTYYFRDYNSAVVMYLKLNDFENSLIKTVESIYHFRGKTFKNINEFTQYLYSNVKEVK